MKIGKMLLVLLPMLIVSGVDGLRLGISGGSGGDESTYGGQFETGDGVGVSGHYLLQGNNLASNCEFTGVGAINVPETRSDSNGDSVKLEAYGTLKKKDGYSTSWSGGGSSDSITGTQRLDNAGTNINCMVHATNRDKLTASVTAAMDSGKIDIQQTGRASKDGADAWQKIESASGDNIWLNAETSDALGKNKADSSVTISSDPKDQDAFLKKYNSEAACSYIDQSKDVDLYAINGPVIVGTDTSNPAGSISGDKIVSTGSTTNQMGYSADYGVTINHGSVGGIYDWGTETTSKGFVIAVPLESPAAWVPPGYSDTINIYGQCLNKAASEIESNSEAYKVKSKGKGVVKEVISQDEAKAEWVSITDWHEGYGFAKSSQAGKL